MGQVLGFSHCKEFGSVTSTPDSTPPYTDGGNEESELYELQTAREWSEDEMDGGEEEDEDDDDGDLASSPSHWGTPRQHSHELTFSYIAIADAEAPAAAPRHHGAGRRRGGGARVGRSPPALIRTDTLETLLALDSPDAEWDADAFLTREEAEEGARRRREEEEEEERERRGRRSETEQRRPSLAGSEPESPGGDEAVVRRGEREGAGGPQHPHASLPLEPPESPVTMDTAVMLLTVVRQGGASSTSSAPIGRNTQEQLVSEQWFSALNLSEGPTLYTHLAAIMDLIYWKDTERTGMVFTGLVVALLSLFQLSLITVVSTLSLAVMCFTVSVRLYYKVLSLMNFGDGTHPFKAYLDLDLSLSGEQADHYMQRGIVLGVAALNALKRLVFVGNFFDSLKFLALVYLVTFLGNLCNGLTLLIVGVISLFSLPLFYKQRQDQVDGVIARIQANIDNIKDIVQRLAQGGGPPPDPTPGGAKPKAQ